MLALEAALFVAAQEVGVLEHALSVKQNHGLYRCGNAECEFAAAHVSDFRDHDHVAICELSVNQMYLACFPCDKQFKHFQLDLTFSCLVETDSVKLYVLFPEKHACASAQTMILGELKLWISCLN